jgi:alanine dehydrogenase
LRHGLNIHAGKLTYKAVADALKLKYIPAEEALGL